ncbi:flavodoxin domain-containing protein [Stutzerimonas nosocomialis]|uniref:flavodoxin domain-containing protein n=1 Tax=Stutzerimonas nosocomialis TaxID=1056496 RepID=UPI001F4F5C4D|nr:sulfite reductase flavoprotein subunit alpha [Stutzerimonas nosocomialis]
MSDARSRIAPALRHWPWLGALLLAVLLLWLRPPRGLSAVLVGLAYLVLCLWYRPLRRGDATVPAPSAHDLLILHASQGGQARALAELSAAQLKAAGLHAKLLPLNACDAERLQRQRRVLFVCATYGEGEAPDDGARFARQVLGRELDLSHLSYAVLALGDRQYAQFCGFAVALDRWLRQRHASPLFDRVEVDRGDASAVRHWQHLLGHLSGRSDFVDWQPAPYGRWRLERRQCLNPGSPGAPIHHLALAPTDALPAWRAGDIAEIGPRQPAATVAAWLERLGLDGAQPLEDGQSLARHLAAYRLPDALDALRGLPAQQLTGQLAKLPHREYSIASVPADGCVELLVRQQTGQDGGLGLGSGWLCRYAALGESIDLRIRSNPAFHGPGDATPVILIGSGTGLAGLRAHLRERAAGSHNWLLFGERSARHDALLDDELQGWQRSGHLARLDRAYSRDGGQVYVQHLLREAAQPLRDWLEDGAALYLCGSLEGMGRDVHQLLGELLGEDRLESLAEQGRYRRDLY